MVKTAEKYCRYLSGSARQAEPRSAALTKAHVQDKFDGIRCQLHCGDPAQPGRVALFSRSRDDMTHSFPELTEAFAKVTEPLILDGEILAWNTDPAATEQRALPFSSLQNRIGRKRVTAAMREQTPVVFMAFDLLYRGDSLLLEQPLAVRRAMLEEVYAAQAAHTVASSTPEKADSPHHQGALFADPDAAPESSERLRAACPRVHRAVIERGATGAGVRRRSGSRQRGRDAEGGGQRLSAGAARTGMAQAEA